MTIVETMIENKIRERFEAKMAMIEETNGVHPMDQLTKYCGPDQIYNIMFLLYRVGIAEGVSGEYLE